MLPLFGVVCSLASDVDDATQNRWMVNYLRHNATSYEENIDLLFWQVGKDEAYCLLKRRVLDEIADKYRFLADECERQKRMI